MRGFTIFVLIMVGAVIMMGPATILHGMTDGFGGMNLWIWGRLFLYLVYCAACRQSDWSYLSLIRNCTSLYGFGRIGGDGCAEATNSRGEVDTPN